jgi:hypothetical protein
VLALGFRSGLDRARLQEGFDLTLYSPSKRFAAIIHAVDIVGVVELERLDKQAIWFVLIWAHVLIVGAAILAPPLVISHSDRAEGCVDTKSVSQRLVSLFGIGLIEMQTSNVEVFVRAIGIDQGVSDNSHSIICAHFITLLPAVSTLPPFTKEWITVITVFNPIFPRINPFIFDNVAANIAAM